MDEEEASLLMYNKAVAYRTKMNIKYRIKNGYEPDYILPFSLNESDDDAEEESEEDVEEHATKYKKQKIEHEDIISDDDDEIVN